MLLKRPTIEHDVELSMRQEPQAAGGERVVLSLWPGGTLMSSLSARSGKLTGRPDNWTPTAALIADGRPNGSGHLPYNFNDDHQEVQCSAHRSSSNQQAPIGEQ